MAPCGRLSEAEQKTEVFRGRRELEMEVGVAREPWGRSGAMGETRKQRAMADEVGAGARVCMGCLKAVGLGAVRDTVGNVHGFVRRRVSRPVLAAEAEGPSRCWIRERGSWLKQGMQTPPHGVRTMVAERESARVQRRCRLPGKSEQSREIGTIIRRQLGGSRRLEFGLDMLLSLVHGDGSRDGAVHGIRRRLEDGFESFWRRPGQGGEAGAMDSKQSLLHPFLILDRGRYGAERKPGGWDEAGRWDREEVGWLGRSWEMGLRESSSLGADRCRDGSEAPGSRRRGWSQESP